MSVYEMVKERIDFLHGASEVIIEGLYDVPYCIK